MEAKRLQRLNNIHTKCVRVWMGHVISELSRFVIFALFFIFIFILVFRLHNVSAAGMLEMQPNEKWLSVTQVKKCFEFRRAAECEHKTSV